MKLNSKGQVTVVRRVDGETRGSRLVQQMRGRASTDRSTDELMELLRGE